MASASAPTPPAHQAAGMLSRNSPAIALLVAALALAYWPSLRAPFLFDDTAAILRNPTIQHGPTLAAFSPPTDGGTTTGRPLVNFSFALNYAISGEDPWSYHALNLALHALAALTLFGLVRRTLHSVGLAPLDRLGALSPSKRLVAVPLPAPRDPSTNGGPAIASLAFFTALLWALHPLQTETVTCAAQRTELLCGLFYLLTLYGFVRGTRCHLLNDNQKPVPEGISTVCHLIDDKRVRRRRAGWLALSVVACLAGMATKEVMVTAPLIVLLYDRTFAAGKFSAALRLRPGYYTALGATWLLLLLLVAQAGGARGVAAGFGLGVSSWSYLLKQCEALIVYLKLTVWPHPLVLDYGTAVTTSPAEVWWQGLVVLALVGATGWALVRKPVLGFVGAWFFVILAPSSSFIPLVTQTIAEHRMYLPLASLIGLLGVTVQHRCGALAPWLFTAAAFALGGTTLARNLAFRDPIAIWTDNVTSHPQVARGHHNLAWTLQQQGKSAEANAHFARAVALEPNYVAAHYSWGVALLDQGRAADAAAQLEVAVQLAPNYADAQLNLGNALMHAGRAADAIPHYEAALRLQSAADVHYDLGVALVETGRTDEAATHFRAALQEIPGLAEAHYQLGRIAERAGRLAAAEQAYNDTLRLAPDHAAAHTRLGVLLARSDRLPPAAEHLRAAVRLLPNDADAHASLGNVLLLQGQPRDAVVEYEIALRLRPNDPRTIENLRLARESLR